MRHKDDRYLRWVRTLPCSHCGNPEAEPHHIIGIGASGMGTKADDIHTMPLCRRCHDEVHRDQGAWLFAQVRWILLTQNRALEEGIL